MNCLLYKEICNDFEIVQGAIWHIKSRPNQIDHLSRNTLFSPLAVNFVLFTKRSFSQRCVG